MLATADISTAVKSTNDAFKTDPLRRYVVETPDSNDTILHKITHNANFSATLADTRAKESNPDGSLDTLIQWLLPYATAYRKGLLSPEQRRRYKEAEDKVHKKVEETIEAGPWVRVCARQGGDSPGIRPSLLMLAVGQTMSEREFLQADEEKRATWLVSSNIANTGFYQSLGFEIKGEIVLGDDNPTWREPAVVMFVPHGFTDVPEQHRPRTKATKILAHVAAEISTAADNAVAAFNDNPLYRYVTDTPDSHDTPLHRASHKAEYSALLTQLVHRGTAWTLGDGAAVVGYLPAKESEPDWSFDKLVQWIIPYAFAYEKVLLSKEQNKRRKEVRDKWEKAVDEVLGARRDAMMSVYIAMTAPAKQGRGYGSMLVRVVSAKADEQKRSIWLISNGVNEVFYKSLGYKTRATVVVGDDNPTWTQSPVPLHVMVREYGDDDAVN
ncbi:hypothetical protein NM688_g6877 [Phlebia brevispora]|uniref:Uncharacterized protein n=1 Tax=Phlebia brevispora TaxID=194682 RepID=A0ACC1SBM5_9APHY|nr:hypothetical protein NM688_g6877 [Phlebia brevispora]